MTEWKKFERGDRVQDGDWLLNENGSLFYYGDVTHVNREDGSMSDGGCGCCAARSGDVSYWWRPTPPEMPEEFRREE